MKSKVKKSFYCPYCGKEIDNRFRTDEHIIPRNMCGPKCFKISACIDCNNKIGREIEQPLRSSHSIRTAIEFFISNGYDMKQRRKSKYHPIHDGYALAMGKKSKIYPQDGGGLLLETFEEVPEEILNQKEHCAIFLSGSSDPNNEKRLFSIIIYKIILGTCSYLWGDEFIKSEYATYLRNCLWNYDESKIIDLKSDDHHCSIIDDENGNKIIFEDAFDNTPNNTICLFHKDTKIISLVNLFNYESMVLIGEVNEVSKKWISDEGIIIIAFSVKNKIMQFTQKDYLKFKMETLS